MSTETDPLLAKHMPLAFPDATFATLFERVGIGQRDDGTFTWVRMFGSKSLKLPLRLSVYPSVALSTLCDDRLHPGMYGLEFWCHALLSGGVLITACHSGGYSKWVGLTVVSELPKME